MQFEDGPGARWWKVDFHAHSPSSFDFGGLEEDKPSDVTISVRDWLLSYMRAEVDAIVVADHNTHLGIEPARTELAALRGEGHEDFRELAIFAGVELTVDGNYHLLAVFDVDTDPEDVNGLLHKVGYKGERGSSNSTTDTTFEQAIAEINDRQGLAIPAHADAPKAGLFGHNQANVEAIVGSRGVRAVEVTTASGAAQALTFGWIPVLGSDAHHLDGDEAPAGIEAKYPGSHFTWLKMAKPNLDGLRVALSDGVDSAIRSADASGNPNDVAHPILRRVIIRDARGNVDHTLSPWMSSVIGGRGTGKSTLVEMIRLGLGRFYDLPVGLQPDLDWYSPTAGGDRVWNESTEIELHFVRSDQLYRVLWSGAEPRSSSVDAWDGTAWQHQAGDARERFPVLINSQKQIYESAQDPQSLLRVIDAQPEIDHASWLEESRRLSSQYKTERAQIAELRTQASNEDRVLGDIADVQAEIDRRNRIDQSDEARELEALLARDAVLASREMAAIELQDDLESALRTFDAHKRAELSDEEWSEVADRETAVDLAVRDVRAATGSLVGARDRWLEVQDQSPLRARISELQQALAQDADEGDAAETIGDLLARRAMLDAQLAVVEGAKSSLGPAEVQAASTLEAVRQHRKELSTKRQEFVSALGNDQLKVTIFAQADESGLSDDLRRLVNKPNAFDAVFERDGLRKVLVANARDPKHIKELDDLRDLLKEVRSKGSASALLESNGLAFDQRLFTHLESLDEHDFQTDVDLWFPDDALQIRYKDPTSGNFINLDQGSPGQKTAALLTLALQIGSDPLILDQPEDDLDNRLIYELVVKNLKRIKLTRQVIVVTHNANVVVNADSELVMVMEHGYPPTASQAGSIQDQAVKDDICLIMEGGRPAFESRYGRLLGAA